MKPVFLVIALSAVALADTESPSGNRTTPPTINSVSPRGVARGTVVEMTVEGLNLGNAKAIYFDRAGVKGKILRVKELPDLPDIRLGSNGGISSIDLGPLPPRNQVTIELDISPEAEIGPVGFRLQNQLGTSPEGRFLVEPYYGESPDREPNNTPEEAFETYLPTILVGEISKPGDVDFYKITAKAGEQLVFENGGMLMGSTLQPIISILREDQTVAKEFGADGGSSTLYFTHKFDKAGTYYIRVADYQQSGRASHSYRVKVGNFPLVTSTFPLGIQAGKTAEIAVKGYQLGTAKVQVNGEAKHGEEDVLMIRPETPNGSAFSEVKLALGRDPEVMSTGTNKAMASAQPVTFPVTINGRIDAPVKGLPVENFFHFHAKKGEKLMFEVLAKRLDSELDSLLEIVDAKGNSIETATVRSIMETFTVLRDHDSATRGIRLASYTGYEAGDYFMIGNEICRVESMPLQPDADIVAESFGGQRMAYFGTSSETQAMDRPVYKVQIYPPGKQFTPNGLPIVRLYYRNDDGGPGYGKDSLIAFTAPADGDYVVKIRDVRGLGGEDYAYRLNIRPPRPDFRLSVNPKNPNVPVGGTIPVTVTAFRKDGFDGKIDVTLEGLPAGLKATTGVIMPNRVATTVLLSADENAHLESAVPLKIAGKARVGADTLTHYANPDDSLKLVALMPKSDVVMQAETKEVTIEAGGSADVLVKILRQNGFGGRVPVEVRNLPPRVRVPDVGLNGVLITEEQTERSFTIEALPSAEPIEQLIYVSGKVETRSGLDSSYAAPQPILLKVKPRGTTLSSTSTPK
jgi:hypothetical protein